jgi:hypothetical protein
MNKNEIRGIVVERASKMHRRLGPSQPESVYEEGRHLPYHKWQTGMSALFFSVSS